MLETTIQISTDQSSPTGVSDTVAPPPKMLTRTFLLGYGHRRRRPLLTSIALYERMEKDYAVGLALAILKARTISAKWTIVVEEAPDLQDDPADTEEVSADDKPSASGAVIAASLRAGDSAPSPARSSADDIAAALDLMLRPLWTNAVKHMLSAISRKSAPFEKIFETRTLNGKSCTWLKRLKPVRLRDAELLVLDEPLPDGRVQTHFGGMRVQDRVPSDWGAVTPAGPSTPIDVPWWKTFWFALDAEGGELVGQSRLENVKRSWWDKNDEDGALDVETLWYRKYVYEGISIQYPEGTQQAVGGGQGKDNQAIAIAIGESILAGGVAAIPIAEGVAPDANPWKVTRPTEQKKSDEVSKWIDERLDHRIMRGLLVAPLVAGGAQTDAGTQSLASVLFEVMAFNLEDILQQVCDWLGRYVLDQVLVWNWGEGWTVRIQPEPLGKEQRDLLAKIVTAIFTGQNAGQLMSLLDLGGLLEQAGLPLAEDATDRIAELLDKLAGKSLSVERGSLSGQNGQGGVAPASPPVHGGLGGDGNANGQGSRLVKQSADRSADELVDESSAAAISFWDSIRTDLKKKRIPVDLGMN